MSDGDSKQDSLRTRRVRSRDRRVLKTRARLLAAFGRLAASGDIGTLTVTALVQESGVTRSSFYAHFSGVGDLAASTLGDFSESVIAGARTTIRSGASKTTVNEQAVHDIIQFISDHRRTYGALLTSDPEFAAALRASLYESTLTTLLTRTHLATDPNVTAHYAAAGTLAVIAWWLTDPGDLTVDDLAHALITVSPPDLRD